MTSVAVRVAGIRLTLGFQDSALAKAVASAWQAFHSEEVADVHLNIEGSVSRAPPDGQQRIPAATIDPLGTLRLHDDTFEASLAPGGRQGWLTLGPDANAGAIDFIVRTALSVHLAKSGGLLLHANAVASTRGAAVFTAPSGGGKSTLAALCKQAGMDVVADELVALIPGRDGFVAQATPWHFSTLAQAPVRCVGLLAFGAAPRIDAIPKADVLRTLIDNIYLPDPSAPARHAAFRVATQLLQAARSVRLTFAPDAQAAGAVETALAL